MVGTKRRSLDQKGVLKQGKDPEAQDQEEIHLQF
jgi:hypothetical protein